MWRIKVALKNAFFSLPTSSKITLYRRLYHGKTPLFSALAEWYKCKFFSQQKELHDVFLDYSENSGVYDGRQLVDRLSTFDVVSFDIFDTLLFRRVEKPTDVFTLVEQRTGTAGFGRYRAECEWLARQKKHEKWGSWEVSFAEIYAQMTAYSAEQKNELQQAELCIEAEQLFANPVMKELAEGLTAHGVKLIVISDMYLDGETLSRFLRNCGFPLFSRIYVSSDEGVSKSEGVLFRRVFDSEHWEGKQIAHIGDNFDSDVRRPMGQGILGIHYIR